MAAPRNALPFQYTIRGQNLQYAGDSEEEAMAIEERDSQLEDFLGKINMVPWTSLAYNAPASGRTSVRSRRFRCPAFAILGQTWSRVRGVD